MEKIIIMMVISLGTFLSEIMIMAFVSQSYLESMGDWDFRNTQIMLITMLGAIFSSLGIWFVIVVWKRVISSVRTPKYAFFSAYMQCH